MTEAVDPLNHFWTFFATQMAGARPGIYGQASGQANDQVQGVSASQITQTIELQEAYHALVPGGELRFIATPGADEVQVWLSGGCLRGNLEKVAALMAAAPAISGWQFEAFERRKPIPENLHFLGQEIPAHRLRFSYKLANNRMGFIILSDGVSIDDYTLGREFARDVIARIIGEVDFCLHVSDAQLIDYQNWLAIVPGGQSFALSELPKVFDPVFSRRLVAHVSDTASDEVGLIAA